MRSRLIQITALAAEYCATLENSREMERNDFVAAMALSLPKIYAAFLELQPADTRLEESFPADYVDEDYYESIRLNIETLLGPDDSFLETFEEDMKYSDTPIASSISECLADIFQPLYNFVCAARDVGSEGEALTGAYLDCREQFDNYWSQKLCNVLRALNNVRLSSH